jgi:hypothetical protein
LISKIATECPNGIRDNVGESVINNSLAQIGDSDDNAPTSKARPGLSSFSAVSMQDDGPPEVDENEDFGGLMVRLVTFKIIDLQLSYHYSVCHKSDSEGKEGQ